MGSVMAIPDYQPGDVISSADGDFTIEKRLGGGGFCTAYLAKDKAGKECVIKHFTQHSIHKRKQYWSREAAALQALTQCKNTRVMKFISAFSVERDGVEEYLLAIEFIPGVLLKDWVPANFPIPYEQTIDMMIAISKQIDCMHKSDWIHRDLSPRNVIIMPDNTPVVIDWGAAREHVTSSGTQGEYTIIGAPGIFAPECKVGSTVTPQTDIYMLGVLFNFLLTSQTRIDPLNPLHTSQEITFELHPRDYQSEIPKIFDDIVSKCTKEEVSSRYSSVEQLIKVLEDSRGKYKGVECPSCHEIVPKGSKCTRCSSSMRVDVTTIPVLQIPFIGGEVRIKPHAVIHRGTIMDSRVGLLEDIGLKIFTIMSREESGGNFTIAPDKTDPALYWIKDLGTPSRTTNPLIVDGKVIPKQKWIPIQDGSSIAVVAGENRIDMKFILQRNVRKKELVD